VVAVIERACQTGCKAADFSLTCNNAVRHCCPASAPACGALQVGAGQHTPGFSAARGLLCQRVFQHALQFARVHPSRRIIPLLHCGVSVTSKGSGRQPQRATISPPTTRHGVPPGWLLGTLGPVRTRARMRLTRPARGRRRNAGWRGWANPAGLALCLGASAFCATGPRRTIQASKWRSVRSIAVVHGVSWRPRVGERRLLGDRGCGRIVGRAGFRFGVTWRLVCYLGCIRGAQVPGAAAFSATVTGLAVLGFPNSTR